MGVHSDHASPADVMQQFGRFMKINMERGCHSFGVLQIDYPAIETPGGQRLGRHSVTRRFGSYNEHVEAQLSADYDNLTTVLGHTRVPTGKHRDDPRCIHPLSTTRFFLAHNGIILNSDHLLETFTPLISGEQNQLPVDSWSLLAGIHNLVCVAGFEVPQAIQLVCDEAEGQLACWLFDIVTGWIYLFRQMSPLFLALPFADDLNIGFPFRCPGFGFSSVDFNGSTHTLEEGKIICYGGGRLGAVGRFKVKKHF
jgi:hypothetical protein